MNLDLETCARNDITSDAGGPYVYRWHASTPPASENLPTLLTDTGDQPNVAFIPPDDLPRDIEYTIGLYAIRSSEPDPNPNNYDGAIYRIKVKNLDPVNCPGEYRVYEGSSPFRLDCTDKGSLIPTLQ